MSRVAATPDFISNQGVSEGENRALQGKIKAKITGSSPSTAERKPRYSRPGPGQRIHEAHEGGRPHQNLLPVHLGPQGRPRRWKRRKDAGR
jgi:hypothetical protein